MIIKTVCAGNIDALLFSEKGNAGIGPPTIKASAGTAFKSKIIRCESLLESLPLYQRSGFQICTLSADANKSLFEYSCEKAAIYVLYNESRDVSNGVTGISEQALSIPMNTGVESLNAAITATLIAYS